MRVFVFGSNTMGKHGAGAALHAKRHHGARTGIGEGMQGVSYAIPTKGTDLSKSLSLAKIGEYVGRFLRHARFNSFDTFFVTAIGTGLAGYAHSDIAPLFEGASENCLFPPEWHEFLGDTYNYHEGHCGCKAD